MRRLGTIVAACLAVGCAAELAEVGGAPETPAPGFVPGGDVAPSPGGAAESAPVGPTGGCEVGHGLDTVRGLLTDDAGTPLVGGKAQVCLRVAGNDQLLCLRPADSGVDGRFVVEIPAESRCVEQAALRAVLPGQDLATTYCLVELGRATAVDLGAGFKLPRTERAAQLPDVGDRDDARWVQLGADVQLEVAPSRLYTGSDDAYPRLAARRMAPSDAPACLQTPAVEFDGMVAFSPEADVSDGGVSLRVRPDPPLPPLTPVALSVLGGLGCTLADGTHVPEAEWWDFGTGIVDEDGFIVARGDDALPCLSWLAWRTLR